MPRSCNERRPRFSLRGVPGIEAGDRRGADLRPRVDHDAGPGDIIDPGSRTRIPDAPESATLIGPLTVTTTTGTGTTTPGTDTTTPSVSPPPRIVGETVVYAGKGRHNRPMGLEPTFSEALDPFDGAVRGRLRRDPRRGASFLLEAE